MASSFSDKLVNPVTGLRHTDYEPVLSAQWTDFLDFLDLGWWGRGVTDDEARRILEDRPNGSVILYDGDPSWIGSLCCGFIKTARRVVAIAITVNRGFLVNFMTTEALPSFHRICYTSLVRAVSDLLERGIRTEFAEMDVSDGLVAEPYDGRLLERPSTMDPSAVITDLAKELKVFVERLKSNGLWWGWLGDVSSSFDHNDVKWGNLSRHLDRLNRGGSGANHGIAAAVLKYQPSTRFPLTDFLFEVFTEERSTMMVHLDLEKGAFRIERGIYSFWVKNLADVLEHLSNEKITLAPYDPECAVKALGSTCGHVGTWCEWVEDGKWVRCSKIELDV